MIHVFDVPARGPTIWIILLTLLQGICGMSFGLVISALCDNEQDAIQVKT
jgi:4-hydroxybenzoate polyprenyltransferase